MESKVKLLIQKLKEMPDFNSVKFVFLFGSYVNKNQNKLSDIDFAIYYDGIKEKRFKFRLKLLSKLPEGFDVQIFQDLPLKLRMSVLKGKFVYYKDIDFVYEIAYQTIKNFEDFKSYYYDYLESRRTKYV